MFVLITDDENIPHLINKNKILYTHPNRDKTQSIIIMSNGDYIYTSLTLDDLKKQLNEN